MHNSNGVGFDFEALKFSGVAAVFFSYQGFLQLTKKERKTAVDRPTKFILVLGKIIYIYWYDRCEFDSEPGLTWRNWILGYANNKNHSLTYNLYHHLFINPYK